MKGLIYRELYLARRSYISNLIAVVLVIVLGVLIRLSLLYGNLAELEEEAFEMVDMVSYLVFSYLPLVLLAIPLCGDGGVSISDYKSKWMLYAYALPVNEKQLAGVKYLIKGGIMLLAWGMGFGNMLLFAGLSGQTIRGKETVNLDGIVISNMEWNSLKILLIIMMVITVLGAFVTPMLLRYKSTNAVLIRVWIVAIGLCFAVIGYLSGYVTKMNGNLSVDQDQLVSGFFEKLLQLRDGLAMVSPFVMIAAWLAGFWLTVGQLKKREIM